MKKMIALILIFIVLLSVTGCQYSTRRIDWQLHGTWIYDDFSTEAGASFGLKGTIKDYENVAKDGTDQKQKDELDLKFIFPKDFRYDVYSSDVGPLYSYEPKLDYFCATSYGDIPEDLGSMAPVFFAVCPEKQYVIIYWKDDTGRFLVASVDPQVEPQEIYNYFEGFMESFKLLDSD